MKNNRIEADRFALWYSENKTYLKSTLMRTCGFDEDALSDVFLSIYRRILYDGVRIKDYMPYMLRSGKYKYLTYRKKASRMMLIDDFSKLDVINTRIN